jgi:hypothetical protein
MSRLKNRGFFLNLIIAAGVMASGAFGFSSTMGSAHEVQISNDVGGTLHIEPNDNPKAGTASLAWFALTRRGGQSIPLSECNCSLMVYAQPRGQNDSPIQQPTLTATTAEGRQGIPSATITFPRAGAYELVLQGRPNSSGSFTPFELRFSVTVAQ